MVLNFSPTIAAVLFKSLIAFSASLFFSSRSSLLLWSEIFLSFAFSIRSKSSFLRSNSSSNLRSANAFLFFVVKADILLFLFLFFSDFKNVSSPTKSNFTASSDVAMPCLDCISIVRCDFSYSADNTFFPIFSTSFRFRSTKFSFFSSISNIASRLARLNSIKTNCASFRRSWYVSSDSNSNSSLSSSSFFLNRFRCNCSFATVLTFSITRRRNSYRDSSFVVLVVALSLSRTRKPSMVLSSLI
mmetsp:Transcript_5540/g.18690  ORF Transcript_5540/g.18690 Transcript_5540/m.18690 type:complete len:244 (-) Transcript_5540:46-777(-)